MSPKFASGFFVPAGMKYAPQIPMLNSDKVYYQGDQSIGRQMRLKRLKIFLDLLETVPKPCRILDVGGEPDYWLKLGFDVPGVHITCANLEPRPSELDFVDVVAADGTTMPQFNDKSFDIVYSNSVIEHVFTWENQVKMANEVRRIGKRYFLQTPNRFFFVEPHFLFPFWQFLPFGLRKAIIKRKRIGFLGPCATDEEAHQTIAEFRLMSKAELRKCFPEAVLLTEKWKGMAKSFMVHHGF